MAASLIRRFTKEEHIEVLSEYADNKDAAVVYTQLGRGVVSRQLVRYWRAIYMDNDGNKAKTDRFLSNQREWTKPEPDDDIRDLGFVPEEAKRILVIPDMHAPYQHADTLAFLSMLRDTVNPDLVVSLGDEADYHALSFHDSDPNLDSAGTELEKAKVFLGKLHDLFPEMLICHSNHGSMQFRRAKAHGIPVQMLKSYRDVLLPGRDNDGWSWRSGWRVKTPSGDVIFKHQSSGTPILDAAHEAAHLCVGHLHGQFSIDFAASSARLYWAMVSGCLIDKHALAFAYGKHSKNKPIIGASAIIDGVPTLLPMILDRDGRWVKR